MTKYGSASVYVKIYDGTLTSLGTLRDISEDVLEMSGLDKEALIEETHGFSETWIKNEATGLKKMNDITLKGFYDDTASTGTHALLNREGTATEIVVVLGGSKNVTIPVLIQHYRRIASRGELHKFEAVLSLAGTPQEDIYA